jgi:YD repeat-containing protein
MSTRALADSLTSLTDSRALETGREVDGFGEVIQEISPDRGTRSYWYDLGSNLIQLVDGDGVLSAYTYDYANRLTAKTFPATLT